MYTDHTYLEGVYSAILTFQNPDKNQKTRYPKAEITTTNFFTEVVLTLHKEVLFRTSFVIYELYL